MKSRIEELSLFGGRPQFGRPLFVGSPNIGDRSRLHALLDAALDRKRLSNDGPLVREFEREVACIADVRHCVAMCNGTVAIQVMLRACELTGEVIMPALTFAATPHAADWIGLKPVFCDVVPQTGTLSPAAASTAVGPATTAILGVHLWGQPCDVAGLDRVARRHGLTLLFDAAHAFGVSHRGRPIGGSGRAEVFSFHATKFVNAFEGGAVVTNDDDLAERMRRLRNFGIAPDGEVTSAGTNGKMSEASAAMGLTTLDAMAGFVAHNRANHTCYRQELAGVPGIHVIAFDEHERHNYQYVVIMVDEEVTGLHRDILQDVLHAENVIARRYFSPGCHWLAPYRTAAVRHLPHTERLAAQVLALPTGTGVGPSEIAGICALIRLAVAKGHDVAARRRAQR